ncbi:MAG: hypothetical protein COU90_03950 [Candidatus Ryanbacteria bacterium CG10_big_fil_rev_8_21_14_0_10_43_42]|uniref:Uncharacterized protein n=1 Tax=Candidatus Ryanbacteria bacterium CG10_big_fil_rev_8_21_14_0_10_43_42 TaxID=1974864 RepID=A0A2M8KWB2_9BACT|nr:MAG: hypothetical protein COU90_03950 [Candidatus Ryanbacteria bacterium CG10_big_fil_rev_8_21_14_0_10_43_42]
MVIISLIIFLLILGGYIAFAAALIYHVRTYVIEKDPTHNFIMPFIVVSGILIILSIIFFLRVPWNDLSLL